jgi:hypothetical protein
LKKDTPFECLASDGAWQTVDGKEKGIRSWILLTKKLQANSLFFEFVYSLGQVKTTFLAMITLSFSNKSVK